VNRPVLILGCIPRIVIPIARSLHRRGVTVDVAGFLSDPRIPPSRAIAQSRRVPRPDVDRSEFVKQLRSFVIERQHDMLVPADDAMLRAVVEHYDDLAVLLDVGCPPPSIACLVLDKTATLAVAQRCGIQIPRTEVVSNSSQLHDLLGNFPLPWVLKPAQKETRIGKVKSCILATADEVVTRFPVGHEFAPPMLVQEYCSGAGVGVEILLHHEECLAVFQHRRTKEFPATGGESVTAVAEAVNQSLLESSLALLRALQWQGIAMVEYKVKPDGRAVLMEVNGRYWGTLSLPIYAGIDFPLYQWELVHGERPAIPKTYAVGTKWRWTVGYLDRLFGLCGKARSSAYARQILKENLVQLHEDFSPSVCDATFIFSDPMPSVVAFFRAMRHFASRTAAALRASAVSRPPQV